MSIINEISRRSIYHEDEGMACGPASATAIMAEIVLDVDGQRVFLHGEWVDIVGDFYYEADMESLFDAYEKLFNAKSDGEEKAIEERDRIIEGRIKDDSIFKPYYVELEKMIRDEMENHGIEYFFEDEEDEEDERMILSFPVLPLNDDCVSIDVIIEINKDEFDSLVSTYMEGVDLADSSELSDLYWEVLDMATDEDEIDESSYSVGYPKEVIDEAEKRKKTS